MKLIKKTETLITSSHLTTGVKDGKPVGYEIYVKAAIGNGDFGIASADNHYWDFAVINGTGDFGFYDGTRQSVTFQQGAPGNSLYLKNNGNVGIGTTSPGSKLSVVGLPTSASGLTSGDIWCDTTGGLNILKIV